MAHAPLPAKHLLVVTCEARESYAREFSDIGFVAGLIKSRAGAGFDWLQINQTRPINLQDTRAARKLITWLSRGEYRIDWKDVVPPEGDYQTTQYPELRIYWSDRMGAVTIPAAKWLTDLSSTEAAEGHSTGFDREDSGNCLKGLSRPLRPT